MKLNDKVKVVNIEEVRLDPTLEPQALNILEASNFQGEITKILDNVFFVGFKNDLGWVTQGYQLDEIEVI